MTKKLAVIISNVTIEEIAAIHEFLALHRKQKEGEKKRAIKDG